MNFVKYTIIGALTGLLLGGLLSIGVVGSHSTCKGTCDSCTMCSSGCFDCFSWWITPVKPLLYATCGCFGFGCYNGCIDWDCDIYSCLGGCEEGCEECNKGCGDCGYSKCTRGCTECSKGYDSDCDNTQEELSNDPDAKKKIKNYLMYLTMIGTVIGAVFGIVCDIQDKEKKRRERKIRKEEQKRIFYSEQLIFAAGNNDKNAVSNILKQSLSVNYKDSYGKTALLSAAINGNADIISLLLEKGANIECKDNNGYTPLLSVVEKENLYMVSFLIDKGAFINCKDSLEQTPLMMALRYNNKDMISLLLEKGADINCSDSNFKTALDYAIENEDADLVSLFLEKGAEIGDCDSSLKTALDFAIKNDNLDLLSRLAEKAANEDVHCDGKPLLFFAIEKNYKKLVELLIEKGVHKTSRFDNEDFKKITPLFFAALMEDKDMVSLLIKNKVDVNEKVEDSEENDCYFSPLERALGRRNKEIATILLENGADINCCSRAITPLRNAVHKNDKDMATFLLGKGANINYIASYSWVDNNGNMSFTATALSEAVKSNNEEMVSFLIENGADVNLEVNDNEKYYYTMLQEAVHVKNKKIVSLLIDAGADVNKNSQKNAGTALITAVNIKFYDPEIVSLLIERGADVNLESAFNAHTPLALAVSQNNKDAVLLLLKNGADPNKRSSELGTPLGIAFKAVNKEMCSLLLEHGADPVEALCISASMPNTEVAQFFLDRGADVNCESYNALTPLQCAVIAGTKEMVLFLISNGADVNYETSGNVSDKTGAKTPLETAIETGNAEMVSLLITYGADVNHKCKNGNTPLLFAARHQRTEIVTILKEAGAVSFVPAKDTQTAATAAANIASFGLQDDSVAFNSALVALSKIIAKSGAEIFAPENGQKLKALVSDLIPQENEIAPKLRQAFSCDFAQTILEATDKSDGKKESSFKYAVNKIVAETGLEKEAAVLIVKLVALSLDWNLENLNLE